MLFSCPVPFVPKGLFVPSLSCPMSCFPIFFNFNQFSHNNLVNIIMSYVLFSKFIDIPHDNLVQIVMSYFPLFSNFDEFPHDNHDSHVLFPNFSKFNDFLRANLIQITMSCFSLFLILMNFHNLIQLICKLLAPFFQIYI